MIFEDIYRWTVLAILASGFGISVYFRRRADRVGGSVPRSRDGAAIAIPLAVFGLAGFGGLLVYVINPAWMRWSQLELPAWVRLSGGPLGIAALVLFVWMFRHLGDNVTPTATTRPRHTLVMTGPYRWIRHPMYSFYVLMLAGHVTLTASWFIGLVSGLGFAVLVVRTLKEEAHLEERFGDEYRSYMRRTGRFVPRLRS